MGGRRGRRGEAYRQGTKWRGVTAGRTDVGARIQRWFSPYEYQIVQEIHRNDPELSSSVKLMETGDRLTPDEERSYAISQLPRETSKHTGFAFDSPGYESFFALQAGVLAPSKAWDVARRASMKTRQPRNDPEVSSSVELMETGNRLTPDEERNYAISQLPRETSKHTGFAFDSPGYESFFALQAGVLAPLKAWDVARRASMKTRQPRTLKD